jgi:nucleotide-binding universal stress UspA family protein
MCLLLGLFHGLKVKPYTLAGGIEGPGVGLAALLEKHDLDFEVEEDVVRMVTDRMLAQAPAEQAALIIRGELGRVAPGRFPSVASAKAFNSHCAMSYII